MVVDKKNLRTEATVIQLLKSVKSGRLKSRQKPANTEHWMSEYEYVTILIQHSNHQCLTEL